MSPPSPPALSVVVVAGAQRGRVQRAIEHLAAQSAADRIEVLLIDLRPGLDGVRVPEGLDVQVIDAPGASFGAARALAAQAAHAGVVAYLEEHTCPQPGWAEAVLAAHHKPRMVVGYAFIPANPHTRTSRAVFLASYGTWMSPPRGPVESLPSSNVSYERSLLLAVGDELPDLLEVDFNLYPLLRGAGARLATEPDARIAHENEERLRDALRSSYNFSRVLAAKRRRVRAHSPVRRVIQALAALAISPLARLSELLRASGRHSPSLRTVLAHAPELLVIYMASAVGESLGVLRGAGAAGTRIAYWELDAPRAGARAR